MKEKSQGTDQTFQPEQLEDKVAIELGKTGIVLSRGNMQFSSGHMFKVSIRYLYGVVKQLVDTDVKSSGNRSGIKRQE